MKWFLIGVLLFANVMATSRPAEARPSSRQPSAEQRSVISDVVKKTREDDEGLVVLFVKNTGSYYLRRDVAQFEAYRKKLEESLSAKKPVSVTVEASQLNILEVK